MLSQGPLNKTVSERRRARERGAEMVESSLVFMVLFLTIFGLMEFGRAVWIYNWVSHAAREGTRYAAVRGHWSTSPATATNVQNVVFGQAVGIDHSNITVNTSWVPDNMPGSAVKVTVSCTIVPAIGLILPKQMKVSATSQMPIAP